VTGRADRPIAAPRGVPRVGVLVLLLTLVAGCAADGVSGDRDAGSDAPDRLFVAAASDLRPAFEELGRRFTETTGVPVAFDFGSSGQLAQRLIEGAAFDVYAAANAAFVEQVLDAGVGDAATQRTYGYGRLVIWSRSDRWAGWERLDDVAADPAVTTVAIANPEHAPYGSAAEQALDATGVLEVVRDRLVLGENISDTQRLVASGNADVGIVALSLAVAADERGEGEWVLVDEQLHEPLQQDLVVTTGDPDRAPSARAFADLVDSDEGREVLRRYGFVVPGEDAPT
jgi:molybdate transport system substrate-binding protein